jgi:salicylate hydroxylase
VTDDSDTAAQIVREKRDEASTWFMADHDHAPFMCKGNVIMIGDAAHATMPFIGNGAAQAIEDSAVLARVLPLVQTREDVSTAFKALENVRMERGQNVVDYSRQCGRIMRYDLRDVPGADMYTREGLDKLKEYMGKVAVFTNEVDVFEQNERGAEEFQRLKTGGSED